MEERGNWIGLFGQDKNRSVKKQVLLQYTIVKSKELFKSLSRPDVRFGQKC